MLSLAPMESVPVKPEEPPPHLQEPEDRCTFGLQMPFGNLLCVLSQCCHTSLGRMGWFPAGALLGAGEGRGGPAPGPSLYFKEAGANEGCLSCAAFSLECHGGRWQPAAL